MTQEEQDVQALLRKKQEIMARTDLSKESKDTLLRRLRRQIRSMGVSSKTGEAMTSNAEPKTDPGVVEIRRVRAKPDQMVKRSWDTNPDRFYEWVDHWPEALEAMKLEEISLDTYHQNTAVYAFDLIRCFEAIATPSDIVKKFVARIHREPKWWIILLQGKAPLLGLGPIPHDNRIEEDL